MRNRTAGVLRRLWRDERGLEMSEVGWMLLVIVVAMMAVSIVYGETIRGVYEDVIAGFEGASLTVSLALAQAISWVG